MNGIPKEIVQKKLERKLSPVPAALEHTALLLAAALLSSQSIFRTDSLMSTLCAKVLDISVYFPLP